MRSVLDQVALMCVTTAAVVAFAGPLVPSPRATPSPATRYSLGDEFVVPGFRGGPNGTMVIWLQTACRYCTDSLGFYRHLSTRPRDIGVVVMGFEPTSVLVEYAARHALEPDQVISVPIETVKLRGTPTVLFVLSDRVRALWIGKLTPSEENQVLSYFRPR